jgi:hypothetical protein
LNRFDKNGRPQKRDEEAGEIIHSIDVAAPAADNLNGPLRLRPSVFEESIF